MAASFLLRPLPSLRLRFRQLRLPTQIREGSFSGRFLCSAADSAAAGGDYPRSNSSSVAPKPVKEPDFFTRLDDPEFRKWKNKEAEILQDVEPIIELTKDILHSRRYLDGERLSPEDEKAVFDKLLAYHPHCEDKIGCGLDYIMVDRHPQFKFSRCLFVVRTDGVWIDFSYQKCLRAYIRARYPSHADQFIKRHFKRS